jgi:hypothetical protein
MNIELRASSPSTGEKREDFSDDFGEALSRMDGAMTRAQRDAYLARVDAGEDAAPEDCTPPASAPTPGGLAAQLAAIADKIGVSEACNGFFYIHAARIDAGELGAAVSGLVDGSSVSRAVMAVLAAAKKE